VRVIMVSVVTRVAVMNLSWSPLKYLGADLLATAETYRAHNTKPISSSDNEERGKIDLSCVLQTGPDRPGAANIKSHYIKLNALVYRCLHGLASS